MALWNRTQKMGWAAAILGASILLSRFMGLIRDKTISYFFGATLESDLYFAAFVIPDFINYLLAGGYFAVTLIPLLAAYFEQDEDEGWHFFSTVLTWIALVIGLFTLAGLLLAPQLAVVAAPGFHEEASARLAFFLRIILPAQICFLLGSCFTAILYLKKQFLVPALIPIVYNSFIILGGIVLRNRGMEGFCWGVLAGALAGNLLLPFWAVRRWSAPRLRWSLAHPGLKSFVKLALPLMIGQSVVVLDEQLVRIFGSLAETGAISWLNYARRIMLVPVGVVAQAAGVASYPFLASLAVRKDFNAFHKTLNTALQNTLFLLVPLSIWMMIVAEPVVSLIFEQGRFQRVDTVQTALLLKIFLASVFCWGVQQIVARGFYAVQDTLTPAVLGTAATALAVPVFAGLTHHFSAVGTACASAFGVGLYTAVLSGWWRRRFGKAALDGLGKAFLRILLFSVLAALPGMAVERWCFSPAGGHPNLSALWAIAASGLCFGLVFGGLAVRFSPWLARPFLERTGSFGRKLLP